MLSRFSKQFFLFLLITTGYFLLASAASAVDAATQQHIAELQAQIEALEAQAAQYRVGIASQREKAASLNGEIAALKGQINATQAQVTATGAKIDKTKLEIGTVAEKIGQTRDTLNRKRDTIGRMVFFLDQADQENIVGSLFKYENLSDFFSQLHDLANIQNQIITLIGDLKLTKTTLEEDQNTLESKQTELEQLKEEADQRKESLDSVKSYKDKLLRDTKGQEALYQKQLTDVEKKQAAFFAEQQKLEAQVVAGGLYIVHVTATNIPPRGTKIFRKPEDAPHVTQGYGMTTYARRGAYGGAAHSGVDYSSGYGTPIKAIGDGTLIAHGTSDGWGNWIAIQHTNNMVSLYGHMSRFERLSIGATVTKGQVIGYEGTTGNSTGSHVHLSLYRDFFTYVNDKNGQLYFNYFEGTLNPLDYVQ